ncbi:CBM35 domain-containing protein [Streptomyces sp. NPDC008313]|uniref:CBM35 domain-containing protein n=1 Tax=Streptomyces sp. NPDC008313 TaxID=3364826 RepID=UPI0036E517FB
MTPGNNGASTPEDDDPFGYLYADGQANGATPPSGGGGYGYPGSVNRVRAVGERQYGQPQAQQAPYGQQAPAAPYGQQPQAAPYGQQGAYGRPSAHYAAPETLPGGGDAGTTRQTPADGGGRGRGPNTRGLLIGAIAVVAAVVIGIAIAMTGGDSDDDKGGAEAGSTATASRSAGPTPSKSGGAEDDAELPKVDAKALRLDGGAATASDVEGADSAGGVYVGGFNQVGASVTWNVNAPEKGKYTLYVTYGVPGKDADATLTVNADAQTRPLNLGNFAKAAEGDYVKGWTNTYASIQLNKGTNTIKISCEQGNQCDANLDQLWLEKGWK